MSGLTLGGGYGLVSRQFGLTCDALTELDLVLASGERLTCNADQNADLFWACRGGGGGNFGVVTSLTFALAPVGEATTFSLHWPWTQAAAVLDAWQQWAPQAPDALTATCHLFAGGKGGAKPSISVGGAFLGSNAALAPLLGQLGQLGAGEPATQDTSSGPYGKMAPAWVDCDGVVAHCQLVGDSPAGQVARGSYAARSDYVTKLLPAAAIAHIVQGLEARAGSAQVGGVLFDPYGGALAKVAPQATAFVHRDPLFSCQYLAFAAPGTTANDAWLHDLYQGMRPYVSGQAYQNYVDPQLADWKQAYYGENHGKLNAIKVKYDAGRFFEFPQAI